MTNMAMGALLHWT